MLGRSIAFVLLGSQSLVVPAPALPLEAPQSAGRDTLRLAELQEEAVRHDARAQQLGLQEEATGLRLRNIAAERLPQLTLRGEAFYQSEVAEIPVRIEGTELPRPPKDRYSAALDAEQLLYDGGLLSRRQAAERARLDVERTSLAAELFPLRAEVNAAFFRALLLQEREAENAVLLEDLEARLALLRSQVEAGTGLPGDTAAVLAEVLRAEQRADEIAADRRAALAVLGELTGRPTSDADVLALPELSGAVARTTVGGDVPVQERDAPGVLGARPEYARFAAERARLESEKAVVEASARPRVVAFGQAGYGRPGLSQFTSEFHEYWLAGVRLSWTPWRWGTTGREREVLDLQQRIVDTEEAAFTDRLRREVQDELRTMEHLQTALASDERIIALREQVEGQAQAQLEERAITAADYVDIRSDLQDARVAFQRHRVELAQAQAQYLTTLGIEFW